MPLYDFLASLWRTVVPVIAGTLITLAAKAGLDIDSATVTGWLVPAFGTLYYAVFRLAEQHISPKWGWLLGLARPPKYTPPAADQPSTSTTTASV